jgi:hypothetical protein
MGLAVYGYLRAHYSKHGCYLGWTGYTKLSFLEIKRAGIYKEE